ncbi:MAG: hypothetical protein R6U68_15275, partial [Desulfobacteraceae bacterium]
MIHREIRPAAGLPVDRRGKGLRVAAQIRCHARGLILGQHLEDDRRRLQFFNLCGLFGMVGGVVMDFTQDPNVLRRPGKGG